MNIIIVLLWGIISIIAVTVLWYVVIPRLKYRWSMISLSRKFRKIAKGKDKETAKEINRLADGIKELGKNTGIFKDKENVD